MRLQCTFNDYYKTTDKKERQSQVRYCSREEGIMSDSHTGTGRQLDTQEPRITNEGGWVQAVPPCPRYHRHWTCWRDRESDGHKARRQMTRPARTRAGPTEGEPKPEWLPPGENRYL
jgi:hypothetical protein